MFRIAWKSSMTGYEGAGEYILEDDKASQEVERLNTLIPYISHWIEPEPPEPLKLMSHRHSVLHLSAEPSPSSETSPAESGSEVTTSNKPKKTCSFGDITVLEYTNPTPLPTPSSS